MPPSHSVLRPSNKGKSLSLFSFPSGILYIITNAQEVSKQHLMTYRGRFKVLQVGVLFSVGATTSYLKVSLQKPVDPPGHDDD